MIQINGVYSIEMLEPAVEGLAFVKVAIMFQNRTIIQATIHKSVYETVRLAIELRTRYGIPTEKLNEFAEAVQHQVRYEDFLHRMRSNIPK